MSLEIGHRGICVTCLQREKCLGFKNSLKKGPAIWDCLGYEPAVSERPDAERSRNAVAPVGIFMGLCSDCTSQEDCCFPFREGGIWFCENYR